jgi:hypothetical protein
MFIKTSTNTEKKYGGERMPFLGFAVEKRSFRRLNMRAEFCSKN